MVRAADGSRQDLGGEQVLSVFLEDLAAHDREGSFERLAAFLELDDAAPVA